MATNHVVQDGAIGIDLNYAGSARAYGLGETHKGDGASEWIFVLFNSAVNDGALCKLESTGTRATAGTGGNLISANSRLGFAQTTYNASQYGFLALAGANVRIRVQGSILGGPGQPLYTTDTAGELSTASVSASQFQVWGVWNQASCSQLAATVTTILAAVSFPELRKPRLGGG